MWKGVDENEFELKGMKKKLIVESMERRDIKENGEIKNVDKKIEVLINLEECKGDGYEKEDISKIIKFKKIVILKRIHKY